MNITYYRKRMVVEFMATEKGIKFEVELTEVKNHFDMVVKENGVIKVEIAAFKIYEEIKDLEIKKNNSKYLSLVINNLISSRKIADEFPLKQIEKKLVISKELEDEIKNRK